MHTGEGLWGSPFWGFRVNLVTGESLDTIHTHDVCIVMITPFNCASQARIHVDTHGACDDTLNWTHS